MIFKIVNFGYIVTKMPHPMTHPKGEGGGYECCNNVHKCQAHCLTVTCRVIGGVSLSLSVY